MPMILTVDASSPTLKEHRPLDDQSNKGFLVLADNADLTEIQVRLEEYKRLKFEPGSFATTPKKVVNIDRAFQAVLRAALPLVVGANFKKWKEWLAEWVTRII